MVVQIKYRFRSLEDLQLHVPLVVALFPNESSNELHSYVTSHFWGYDDKYFIGENIIVQVSTIDSLNSFFLFADRSSTTAG